MRKKYLLAIDAGTGSGRAVLFDTEGHQIAVGQEEWTHFTKEDVPNSMNFDFETNWDLICRCIKQAIQKAGINSRDILAVSATSMREGIVLYDEKGNELWAVANVDARSSKEVKELKEKFEGIEEEFYKKSGQTFALGALPRLLWVKKKRPNIYEKIAKISMISDWALAKLSGVIASDPSNAGTSGIFSLEKREWESEMAQKVGLKDMIFPPVIEPGTVIGEVTKKAAKESSLKSGTKVVMGGGDVQLGSAGLGIVKSGEAAILGGTFWQQVVNVHRSKVPDDMSVRVNPHVVPGLSQVEGITFFSGLIMRWFRDAFCEIEKAEANERGVDVYTILEEKASKVPVGSNGIIPIFSDEMKYRKWYHASPSFLNLSIDPNICNKASMFRSLQENACIVSAQNLENISQFTAIKINELVFAGGASKGFLWPQILADVTGIRVKIPKVKEATALGCAMAAGVGIGIYESLENASQKLVEWEMAYEPNMLNHEKYNKIRQNWQKAYKAQLQLVDHGITKSMWKAPGL